MSEKPTRRACRHLGWVVVILLAQFAPAPDAHTQAPAPAPAPAHAEHKQVLVLYATRRDSELSLVGESVLPRILEAGLDRSLDYHSEFIDFTRFTDPAYQTAFHDFIRLKYQLRRWGIDESRVPAGTSVRFRDPTIWDRYKHYIFGAVALLLIQTVLITRLLIQRKRRRKAEDELRQSQNNLRQSYERNRDLGARLLKAQETERARIARELHDDICQRMLLLTIAIEALTRAKAGSDTSKDSRASSGEDSAMNSGETPARDVLTAAQDISRSLHELSHRLHPERLRTVGLATAVGRLCAETSRAGIPIQYTHENVPPRLSSELMLCLFRIVQESLQNAIKYSHAKAVSVRLTSSDAGLILSIVDDGVGFDVEDAWGRGVGLVSMVERLEAIGGSLEVNSHPGGGARLTASVPPDVIQSAAPTYDSTHSPH